MFKMRITKSRESIYSNANKAHKLGPDPHIIEFKGTQNTFKVLRELRKSEIIRTYEYDRTSHQQAVITFGVLGTMWFRIYLEDPWALCDMIDLLDLEERKECTIYMHAEIYDHCKDHGRLCEVHKYQIVDYIQRLEHELNDIRFRPIPSLSKTV